MKEQKFQAMVDSETRLVFVALYSLYVVTRIDFFVNVSPLLREEFHFAAAEVLIFELST